MSTQFLIKVSNLNYLQMTEVLKAGVLSDEIDLGALAHNAAEQAEEFVRKVSYLLCLSGILLS